MSDCELISKLIDLIIAKSAEAEFGPWYEFEQEAQGIEDDLRRRGYHPVLTYGLTCIARSIVSSEVEITGNIEVGDQPQPPAALRQAAG
jgi:hypothetical protein